MSQHCHRNAKAELVQQLLAANKIFLVYIAQSPWQLALPMKASGPAIRDIDASVRLYRLAQEEGSRCKVENWQPKRRRL
jgi:hypothetical protein